MLVVRGDHVDALRESAVDRYATRVAGELRRQYSSRLTGTSDQQLKELVHAAVGRSREYGVVNETDVKRYAEYMVEYGHDFDRSKWAHPILTGTKTGTEKMDDLDDYTTFELRS